MVSTTTTTTAAFWPTAGLLFCIGTFLSLSKTHRDTVLSKIGLRGAGPSSARPGSPNVVEKQLPSSDEEKPSATVGHGGGGGGSLPPSKPLASSTATLKTTFPPSQRGQLAKLLDSLTPAQRQVILGDDNSSSSSTETLQRDHLLGFDEDYRSPGAQDKFSYSGFSVREIRALGDFPDYATLCEVPLPRAYPEFDIEKARPRPYRPFRWGYHQTMSLTKMDTDWWIELESTYKQRIAQRQELHRAHGTGVLQALPGSELACKELVEMVVQFLCARYPHYFRLSPDKRRLHNEILGTVTDFPGTEGAGSGVGGGGGGSEGGDKWLMVLLDNVPEDFALTLRDPDTGLYHFRAGVICSALGWNVATKIGLRLDEIHKIVPDYKEKMAFSMDRFFSKMAPSKPIQRGSWGLEIDEPLYLPPGHPHLHLRTFQDPSLTPSQINLRVDWQTLRRLPLSGSVVFNFKALFTPVTEFRDEPYVPGLCVHVLKNGKRELMKYKDTWHVEHVAVPLLEGYHREQRENGVIVVVPPGGGGDKGEEGNGDGEDGWEPKTLDESPWFPGWEDKWHRQQGF